MKFKKGEPSWNKGRKGKENHWFGKKHSKETIDKISKTHLGENNPMYGKKVSEQTIKKMIESKKGYKHSEETKKKIGLSSKGRVKSEETRRKISEGNVGKIISEETKQKMRNRKLSEEAKKNISNSLMGRFCSEETKQKMRISRIEYIKNNVGSIFPNIGRYEKQILDELENRFNNKIVRQFFINGYFLDGYIPELNLAIEIDEEKHFNNGELREKDLDKQNNIMNSLNCGFLRIRVNDIVKDGKLDIELINIGGILN